MGNLSILSLVSRRSRRLKPVIVDPGLYLLEKTDMFFATQKRDLPKAFKLFSGMFIFLISAPLCG